MARSCEDLAGDRLALRVVFAFTAIGGPLQAFAVARLRGLDAWHTTLQPVLMARLGQAAVLVLLLCVLQDRWYSARRTAALTAANVSGRCSWKATASYCCSAEQPSRSQPG